MSLLMQIPRELHLHILSYMNYIDVNNYTIGLGIQFTKQDFILLINLRDPQMTDSLLDINKINGKIRDNHYAEDVAFLDIMSYKEELITAAKVHDNWHSRYLVYLLYSNMVDLEILSLLELSPDDIADADDIADDKVYEMLKLKDYYYGIYIDYKYPKIFTAVLTALLELDIFTHKHDYQLRYHFFSMWYSLHILERDKRFYYWQFHPKINLYRILEELFNHKLLNDIRDYEVADIISCLHVKDTSSNNIKYLKFVYNNTTGDFNFFQCFSQNSELFEWLLGFDVNDEFDYRNTRGHMQIRKDFILKIYETTVVRHMSKNDDLRYQTLQMLIKTKNILQEFIERFMLDDATIEKCEEIIFIIEDGEQKYL